MSDAEVLRLIEDMERLLESGDDAPPEPETVEAWHRSFQAAVAAAERGPDWPGLVTRAHAVAARIESTVIALSLRREAIRQEMETQAAGQRALKGYRPGQR